MKNLLALCMFIIFSNAIFAQTEAILLKDSYQRQIGVDFTNFFLRFVSFNESNLSTPVTFLYLRKGDEKIIPLSLKIIKWDFGF